ncbi:class I SAM-dependent methyltransferase [Candidatus Woesearchaeota archaeon]|nr:class I SAM-dependent methyltransferase [Candidatus Woesearchaeota archaeon]
MITQFNTAITRQAILANGDELASIMGKDREDGKRVHAYPDSMREWVYEFDDPVLVTDNWRISQLAPRIRDTLFSLFSSPKKWMEYDGISVHTSAPYRGVWSPSIDTLVFANALRQLFCDRQDFRVACEIGCGSGFLSKYVLHKLPEMNELLVNDLNVYAIRCAQDNIQDERAKFLVGDGLQIISRQKFDLLICNPPYVPRPNSIDDNAYEGIGLLEHLLSEGRKYLNKKGVLAVNASSLCPKLFEKANAHVSLCSKNVPLKVNNILNNQRWMAYLRKLGLKYDNKNGYEYWHNINIVAIHNN